MTDSAKPPVIDPATLPERTGAPYPPPFRAPVEARRWRVLGDAAGLTQFGVNVVELPPGCWSSQRHWHSHEDELVYVLEGELVLVTDAGERLLTAGLAAGFPGGKPDGHHFINRSGKTARYLAIGSRIAADLCDYSDIDMREARGPDGNYFADKAGRPY